MSASLQYFLLTFLITKSYIGLAADYKLFEYKCSSYPGNVGQILNLIFGIFELFGFPQALNMTIKSKTIGS